MWRKNKHHAEDVFLPGTRRPPLEEQNSSLWPQWCYARERRKSLMKITEPKSQDQLFLIPFPKLQKRRLQSPHSSRAGRKTSRGGASLLLSPSLSLPPSFPWTKLTSTESSDSLPVLGNPNLQHFLPVHSEWRNFHVQVWTGDSTREGKKKANNISVSRQQFLNIFLYHSGTDVEFPCLFFPLFWIPLKHVCVHTRHFWNESVPRKVWIKRRTCQKNYEGTSSCRKRHPWDWQHILLVLSLQAGFWPQLHKTGQAPVRFRHWGQPWSRIRRATLTKMLFTRGHSRTQLGQPFRKDMQSVTLRDNVACLRDV